IPLPTYPFEKKRHWIDPPVNSEHLQSKQPLAERDNSSSNVKSTLLKIWKQFLGIDNIKLCDNFFTLGGDSLLAIQVISQIQLELSIPLKLQTIFQFPTINQLTREISQKTIQTSCLVSLKSSNDYPPLFIVHGIDGNIFSFKSLAEVMTFPGPIIGIQANKQE